VEGAATFRAEAGDLAFEERAVDAAGAGEEDVRDGGALVGVGEDALVLHPAAEEFGEFGIDNEAEAAGEIVAGNDAVALESDGAGVGAEGPGVGSVAEAEAELGGFEELGGVAPEAAGEGGDTGVGSLFSDQEDFGAAAAEVGGDGEEQGGRSRRRRYVCRRWGGRL